MKRSNPFRLFLKSMIVSVLRRFFKDRGIPILRGPLRGKLLTLEIAEESLAMWTGKYEPHVVSALLHLPDSIRVAYDIGAHVGYMTLALAQGIPQGKVFAFEPFPDNQVYLQQVIAANHLEDKVSLVPQALSNQEGLQRMYPSQASSLPFLESALIDQEVKAESGIMVFTTTLDLFIFSQMNPVPDILKIDVEGAELFVLEGGRRLLKEFLPQILLEIHGLNNARKIWRFLQIYPYRWWHLESNGKRDISAEDQLFPLFFRGSWTAYFLLEPLEVKR